MMRKQLFRVNSKEMEDITSISISMYIITYERLTLTISSMVLQRLNSIAIASIEHYYTLH